MLEGRDQRQYESIRATERQNIPTAKQCRLPYREEYEAAQAPRPNSLPRCGQRDRDKDSQAKSEFRCRAKGDGCNGARRFPGNTEEQHHPMQQRQSRPPTARNTATRA